MRRRLSQANDWVTPERWEQVRAFVAVTSAMLIGFWLAWVYGG